MRAALFVSITLLVASLAPAMEARRDLEEERRTAEAEMPRPGTLAPGL